MKFLNKAADIANSIFMFFVLILTMCISSYGVYVLLDIFCINHTAFISHDLLQYRPIINAEATPAQKTQSFQELKQINSDTVGWVEIFDTHINYPVMQGKDDLEYLNKDIYGNSTLSGSIYLAADNDSGFNDWYNLLYGHHMDNGAMFGDISKFLDQDYFQKHRKGLLQTETGTYVLNIFACISTDSYEGTVYRLDPDAETRYPVLKEYIESHSMQHDIIPDHAKVIAFSTCTDAATNGRIVLFADLRLMEKEDAVMVAAYEETPEAPKTPVKKLTAAIGKLSIGSSWALLNLICVCYTLLTLLPVLKIRRKYRQISFSKKKHKELSETENPDQQTQDIIKDLRGFIRKMRFGYVLELCIVILAAIVFILTEDIGKTVVLCDEWTWLMVLMAAFSLLIDFICFRYRGIRPDSTNPQVQQTT